ncbi:MAG: 6,7-dimethyl-8-ribityllumazine synthase [Phycisphaerales bacterium]|nr:6,7-dimethyl-8-ribityllumazine synthase [Phycisphaerales bacterium]
MAHQQSNRSVSSKGLRMAVAVSRYHSEITEQLLSGARDAFLAAGGAKRDFLSAEAPGSYELIAVSLALAKHKRIDGIVALGCVLTGETSHDRYICEAVASGLAAITLKTGKPVAFGLLTCQTLQQAQARAGGNRGNKGEEAMMAAVACVRECQRIESMRR